MNTAHDLPARGFTPEEFAARTERAQALMAEADIAALLVCTEPEVRYFTGFHTPFWQSPTRPWFTVVPASGKPIAVIPSIGVAGMRQTWIEDIRSWSSPQPDDDGVSLLPRQLEDVSTYPVITQELLNRGYTADEIKKINSGNIMRVLRQAEAVAERLKKAD